VRARTVQEQALRQSVFVITGEPFYADGSGGQQLRLCFSARLPDAALRAARTIGAIVAEAMRHDQAAAPMARLV
jgi:DNA-binding transcriptional MocR family regulator